MKKISGKFLLIQAGIMLAISFIVGLLLNIYLGAENLMSATVLTAVLVFVFLLICVLICGNSINARIAKKTMEKGSAESGFEAYSTFASDAPFTIGSVLRIDESTGKIGYVSYQNPYEFQLLPAKDITKIKSSYIKGVLGGTSYVYFEFYYNNKRVRIPTFTSNNQYHLQSEEVLEGIAKADTFCEILENAKNSSI